MPPLALTDQQLKTVLDVAGFVPRRLRRKFLKDIAAQLPVVPGTKNPEHSQLRCPPSRSTFGYSISDARFC